MKIVDQFIVQSPTLRHLLYHIQAIEEIRKTFQTVFPLSFSRHCHIANFKEKILIVHVDSSLRAAWLRYRIPEFVQIWQSNDILSTIPIEKVEIRVRFPYVPF